MNYNVNENLKPKKEMILNFNSLKDLNSIQLKNNNEECYAKIINLLFEQCKNFKKENVLVKILEEIKFFKEIWNKKNISKNYNILIKEKEKLKDVYIYLKELIANLKNKDEFYEIIVKHAEDFNHSAKYEVISKLFFKLTNLKNFYIFSSEETLKNQNTITFNKENYENSNDIIFNKDEIKRRAMKVYADNYNEIFYNKYPKKLKQLRQEIFKEGEFNNKKNIEEFKELLNSLSEMLDLFKECYLKFNYYEIGTRYFIFNDLLRKFETCIFKAKEKLEKQKKYFSIKKKACEEYNSKKRILDDEYSKYDFVKVPSLWDSYKNVLSNINIKRYVKILKCYKSLLSKEDRFYEELNILIEKIYEVNNFFKSEKEVVKAINFIDSEIGFNKILQYLKYLKLSLNNFYEKLK